MKRNSKKTFFFFAPEAGVQPHFVTLCILASILQGRGHSVFIIQCNGLFQRCPVMDCCLLPYETPLEQRTRICNACYNNSNNIIAYYGLKGIVLNDSLTPEVAYLYNDTVDAMPADVRHYIFDGIPMGKACMSDMILASKQYDFDNPKDWVLSALRQYTTSFQLTYLLINQLCAKHNVDGLFFFNDYSLMLSARLAAKKNHIPSFTVTWANHKGVDFQNFIITNTTTREAITESIIGWQRWRELSINEGQIKKAVDDVIFRQTANNPFVYSPTKTQNQGAWLKKLNLEGGKKVVVAYTSSYDEVHAADILMSTLGHNGLPYENVFDNQVEWLETLTQYVENRDDLQLVVRIHPREAPNKRDSGTSQHLRELRMRFDKPFNNCRIIWPESDISSYDLAEIADLALIGWTTLGLELARAGIPVLAMTRGIMYPGDQFVEWAPTVDMYIQKLAQLLSAPPDIKRTILAYRFYNYWVFNNSVSLSDVIPTSNYTGAVICPPPLEAATIEHIVTEGDTLSEINFERLRSAQEPESDELEVAALKRQLRRLLHFYFTRDDSTQDFHLVTLNNVECSSEIKAEFPTSRFLVISGNNVYYLSGNLVDKRYSPMCARIGLLSAQYIVNNEYPSDEVSFAKDQTGSRKPGKRRHLTVDISDLAAALVQARQLLVDGKHVEALDIYEDLARTHPTNQLQLLCELHTIYNALPQDRYTLYVSRYFNFLIEHGNKILDIGSGHLPFPLATHLADISLSDGDVGRAGIPFKHQDGKSVYECNLENLPFQDKEFDFVYCSHVLEHVESPEKACRELMRVGKRGYIETPTKGKDQWLNTAAVSNHRWWIEKWGDTLIFTEYTPEEVLGFDSNILLDMHCNPQSEREKAFSALLYLKADQVNVMHYWESSITCEVRRIQNPGAATAKQAVSTIHHSENTPEKSCLFLNTYYDAFMRSLYSQHEDMSRKSYREQLSLLVDSRFGDSDFYSEGLKKAGWSAADLILNCDPLQEAWARENGFGGEGLAVAIEQIRRMRPRVLYLQNLGLATREFFAAIRPHTDLIIGQIASPIPERAYLQGFDIIFSSFPHFVERFRSAGITSYYQPLAFDYSVLRSMTLFAYQKRPVECSFVGGISPMHGRGYQLLEQLAGSVPIDFWGYGADSLPPGSAIRNSHHGEAWGKEMFYLLGASKITINRHIDVAENYANNMRLFEATGCGALLITDYRDNLNELFEIGKEVVAYRSADECEALIRYYQAHPDEAEAIARAGQARTLRDHTYDQRMDQTAELLERHLRYKREKDLYPVPDISRISCGHSPISNSEVTPELTSAWQNPGIPARQRALVQQQLAEMYSGKPPVPFKILANVLRPVTPIGASVLEIGCASGYYYEVLEYLLNRRINYTGVDYSNSMIDMARDYYPKTTFITADGASLSFADRQFSIVISSCVLLHVPNYRQHIIETARVADMYIVSSRTPICRRNPTQFLKKLAYDVDTVELIFNENEFLGEFAKNGFSLLQTAEYSSNQAEDRYEATYLFKRV